jgi:hypothetical protein
MSEHKENYCTGKGLPLALAIIVFMLVGAPFIALAAIGSF